jgi:hypothetical protein
MTKSELTSYIKECIEEYINEAAKLTGTDKYGNYVTSCKLKGTNITIHVHKGEPDEIEANNMIQDLEGYTKILNKEYNKILEEVAKNHMDYARNCYEGSEDNYYKKYAENLGPNKSILKLISARYLGKGDFDITFDSELIAKDMHLCFVELRVIDNKVKVCHVTFEG